MFKQYIKQTGRSKNYNYPTVSLGKTHFSFNTSAIETYNFLHQDKFLLFYEPEKQIVKFTKIPTKTYGCLSFVCSSNKSIGQISSIGFIKFFNLKTTKPVSIYRLESIGSNQYIINLNNNIEK